ncbi:copper-translocating P-t [Lindgomyces ingoldianus]|uniref:Copper-translocating P-t n=1 Tax=Lindgomyces ingoldianus TaxID=673940 RepID=A0ACB6QNC8_9PLEO|nr:copper-translocating P-t [Lindgomyces ingoldianus]KAF2468493.1 copper-translocating P-t [Lindgomyces ingoldianus]
MDKGLLKEGEAYPEDVADVERGPATFERVVLTISGLKCGCCESGISKAFRHIPAIKDHQVNIVLARVEFDLDTSRLSISAAISRLTRVTGYTFEKHDQPEGQILEVLVNDPRQICEAGKPYGVTLIESGTRQFWSPSMLFSGRNSTVPPEASRFNRPPHSLDSEKSEGPGLFQHTVRIHYDANLIGARDVFEYYQQLASGQHLQLAHPCSHPILAVGADQTKQACIMFLISLFFTIPVLVMAWAPLNQNNMAYAHVSLALATIVQIIAVKEFVPSAFKSLIHSRSFEMDFLVAFSTTTAYVFSVVSYVFQIRRHPLETGSFFETSTLLVTLILFGRVVNEFARLRAAKAVSFRSLQAEHALLVVPGQAQPREARKIDARLLQYGDSFKVPPHTRIVTDGKVIYGGSEVDESVMTGESIPVAKGLGHTVSAGTTNGSGELTVTLTALPHENSISKIAAMVESAELSKPKVQALADRIAGWFVPAIMAIGTIVFVIWICLERYGNRRLWRDAVIRAITYAIATIIVSCPCAIGLAVPMVVLIAGGVSARFGIIFRDPQKLEVARNATDIIFDKTGTLTTGDLTVVEAIFHGPKEREVKSMILGLLVDVKHPVAAAVFKWLDKNSSSGEGFIKPAKMVGITSLPGNGVIGTCKQTQAVVRAGNPYWLGVDILESPHSVLCVTVSGELSAVFRLQDRPRSTAERVIRLLTDRGISVHMISGDSAGAVNEIAHTLNIPKHHACGRLNPGDKQEYIHNLQKEGRVVLFCGDGTNDSVALKQADVGVHMNHGSDVAKSASDVVLMTTRLQDIPILLDISKAAYRRIMFNFGWSAVYNVVAILMAAGAFVAFRIPPAYAGLGELVSVLPVMFIAFQLRWRDYGKKYRGMEYE